MPRVQEDLAVPYIASVLASQHRQWAGWRQYDMTLMLDLEQASTHWHGNAHDDGLTHTSDVVHSSVQCCIKQVVCGLFKGCQHEHAVLHLGNAEPSDTQYLSLQPNVAVKA